MRKFLGLIGVTTLLAGCAMQHKPVVTHPQRPTAFQNDLTTSVHKVEHQLALLDHAKGIPDQSTEPTFHPPKVTVRGVLATRGAFKWNGKLDPALKKIAHKLKWHFVVQGTPPTTPVHVAISASHRRWYDILHTLADQAGSNCVVSVDGATKTISAVYSATKPGMYNGSKRVGGGQS